jgi:hypothetical protein
MKPFNDFYEYTIAAHFLTALINNDFSGFSDLEENQFNAWHDSLPKVAGALDFIEEEAFFAECEICGLYADCHTVRLHFHNAEVTA